MTRYKTQLEWMREELNDGSDMTELDIHDDPDIVRDGDPVRLVPSFSFDKFRSLVQYEIIVECWKHKESGRGKRRWMAEFTDKERATISRYYKIAYKWYLVDGPSKRVSMHMSTLQLLAKAVEN